jgi:hypothetical protein
MEGLITWMLTASLTCFRYDDPFYLALLCGACPIKNECIFCVSELPYIGICCAYIITVSVLHVGTGEVRRCEGYWRWNCVQGEQWVLVVRLCFYSYKQDTLLITSGPLLFILRT